MSLAAVAAHTREVVATASEIPASACAD